MFPLKNSKDFSDIDISGILVRFAPFSLIIFTSVKIKFRLPFELKKNGSANSIFSN